MPAATRLVSGASRSAALPPIDPALPTLVFDLDGTLVDSAPDLMATLNVILAREDAPPLPVEAAGTLLGAGARALLERGFAVDGRVLAPDHMERLYDAFLTHYADHLADATRPYDGVEATLLALAGAGHRLAVCTNKVTWHSERLLALLQLDHFFAAICGRDAFPAAKPDPRHLTMTIEQAGGDPARAVMIGDSKTDVATARAAGLPCVVVSFGYTDIPPADLGADRLIDRFADLPGALAALGATHPA